MLLKENDSELLDEGQKALDTLKQKMDELRKKHERLTKEMVSNRLFEVLISSSFRLPKLSLMI